MSFKRAIPSYSWGSAVAVAMPIPIGIQGEATLTVTDADTAVALGSGDVEVLGTPRLIALLERACCLAVEGYLPEGGTSVGTRVDVVHRRPTPLGAVVTASAELVDVQDKVLVFEVTAGHHVPGGPDVDSVMAGTMTRVLVQRAQFVGR